MVRVESEMRAAKREQTSAETWGRGLADVGWWDDGGLESGLRVGLRILRVGSESGNTSEVYAGGVYGGPLYFVVKWVGFDDTPDESRQRRWRG